MRLKDGTYVARQGARGGPPVVLIHGLGLNAEMWQWTSPALSDAYDVITYDLYGHGQSAPPPERPSLGLFARQLADVLDAQSVDRAILVGFSLGGMICRKFAVDYPERVQALAILNSPHRRAPAAQDAILKRVEQARLDGPKATVEQALERWFTEPYRRANPAMMDLVRNWVLANDPAIYPIIYAVLATGIEEIVDLSLKIPALVLTADEDYGNGPEMTQAIADEIEGADPLILKSLRHMALVEDPASVNVPLRAFLDRVVATASPTGEIG